ncbi:MAG: hypothetical protein ACHQNT_07610 [Bacteroidia bacterium]
MKKLFIIVFLTYFVYSLPAQTFTSRKENGSCAQMTIRYEGSTVYYHIDEMEGNCSDTYMMFINQTDIPVIDRRFTIPDDGQNYWMISFEANEPPQVAEKNKAECVICHCIAPDNGSCDNFALNGGHGYCWGNCWSCDTIWVDCDGAGFKNSNGLVLVQADAVSWE